MRVLMRGVIYCTLQYSPADAHSYGSKQLLGSRMHRTHAQDKSIATLGIIAAAHGRANGIAPHEGGGHRPPPRHALTPSKIDVRVHRSFDSTLGYPGEGPPRAVKVVTLNITGWGTFMRGLHAGVYQHCDIILLQETHLPANRLSQARHAVRKSGFQSAWSAAFPTRPEAEERHHGGGVAILWPTWMAATAQAEEVIPGRCLTIPLIIPGLGRQMVGTFYGPVGGMSHDKIPRDQAWDIIAHHLRRWGGGNS